MDDCAGNDAGLSEHVRDAPVTAALTGWATGRSGRVKPLPGAPHLHGKTGARLFAILLTRSFAGLRGGTSKLLVKVLPAGSTSREAARHEEAWHSCPWFAKRHLVEQYGSWYPVADGRHLMFQRFAHDGDLARTLDELDGDDLVEAVQKVLDGVLNDWNAIDLDVPREDGLQIEETTAGEYVRRELSAMDSLAEAREAAVRLGLDPAADWLAVDGRALPNPLRLLDADGPLAPTTVLYVAGRSHGDLHGGNALIPVSPAGKLDAARFRLVDLSNFEHRAPLTRDLVALALSTILRHLPDLPARQADELLRCLIDPDGHQSSWLPPVLTPLVRAVHQLGINYAAGWVPQWRAQYRLSLISYALICTTFEDVEAPGRRWCLRLAGEAAEAYRQEALPVWRPPATDGLPPLPADPGLPARTGGFDPAWPLNATPSAPRSLSTPPEIEFVGPVARPGHGADGPGRAEDLRNRPYLWSARRNAPATREATPGSNGRHIPEQRSNDQVTASRLSPTPSAGDRGNAGPPPQPAPARRHAGLRHRARYALIAVGLSVVGAMPFVPTMLTNRREAPVTPSQVPPTGSSRSTPSTSDRNAPRTRLPLTEPGPKLTDLAVRVAALPEKAPHGRYTYTCVRIWSPDTGTGRPIDWDSYRDHQVWWTTRGTGREVETAVTHGRRRTPQVTWYATKEWTAGLPLPRTDPADLREQLADLADEQPPELRDGAGAVLLVVRFHRYHVLSPAQRSALLLALAAAPGITYRGEYPDRAGRVGVAVSADGREGRRETLLFDRTTGELLSHETTSADQEVLGYHLFRARVRTDSSADRKC
ncbi:hypothetical protein B0E53_02043 [Micromonospora sp. MH33]|uniref:hypothetical protein n=1 Tax=Micromonospora sp. MH33 TaxID=1945509 RepID=UPI000D14927A|nr:hypothetical protein [Micromonospora sp. MH33]PSK66006.1 hypothetical protein B0E53_02043 [Micromonospora sp. MH33]